MKTIAQIIIELRGGLEGLRDQHIRIDNEPWMPLVIEHAGEGPGGNPTISVCHFFLQEGDTMYDPEVVFTVNPSETPASIAAGVSWKCGAWVPVSYTQHSLGIYREAIYTADDGRIMQRPALVKDLTAFAKTWSRNIANQKYREAAARAAAK